MGAVCAVLRLGERADARPAGRAVLEPGGRSSERTGTGTRLRHRPHLASARSRGRIACWHRSVRGHARACPAAITETPFGFALDRSIRACSRRHSDAAVPRGTVLHGLAPYGVLQSLLRDRDLSATLESVSRVLEPGGIFGLDLVPDVPNWREYRHKVQLRGRAAGGAHLTLIESVRQEPRRHFTTFEQCYIERRGRTITKHRFELTFRTLPIRAMARKIEGAGFAIDAVLGDYRGRPWDHRSDVWIIMARRK